MPSSPVDVEIFSAPRSAVTVAPGTGRVCARTTPRSTKVSLCAGTRLLETAKTKIKMTLTKGIQRKDSEYPAAGYCGPGYLRAAVGGLTVGVDGAVFPGIRRAVCVSLIFFKLAAWTKSAETRNFPVLFIKGPRSRCYIY